MRVPPLLLVLCLALGSVGHAQVHVSKEGLSPGSVTLEKLGADVGAWVEIPFDAGNFTSSGTMTWTVEAGDVFAHRYLRLNKLLILQFVSSNTTVGGTPSTELRVALPPGIVAVGSTTPVGVVRVAESGVYDLGWAFTHSTWGYIRVTTADTGVWAATTNQTHVQFIVFIAVT